MSTFQRRRSTHLSKDRLPLKDAIKSGDLVAFIALVEAEGFGAADGEAFKRALTAVAKPKQSKRHVSRSSGHMGSAESQSCPPR